MPAAARLCVEGTFGPCLSLPSNRAADLRREAVAAIADPGHHRWLRLKLLNGSPARKELFDHLEVEFR
jgi:hypothetical protein